MAITSNFPAIRPSLNLDFANARTLDPRITFSRASAATYYDGKTVAKAEENLLTYSQDFASWGVSGTGQCSVTSDVAVAPDGTMTADLLFPDTSTAGYRAKSNANTVATSAGSLLSFYVKPAGYNFVSIVLTNSFGRATIDVTSGTITNYGANAFSVVSTTLVGSWYRVVLSVSASITASSLWLGPNSAQRDPPVAWAGDGTSGIYLWGAQLEQRSQVTAYTPTTTQPITNYIPVLQTALAGVPRFDHNPVTGESLGLLVEEQRTNLLLRSQEFDLAWGKVGSTVLTNILVSPDGTLSADKVIADTALSSHRVDGGIVVAQNSSYTFSCFAKAGEYGGIAFNIAGGAAAATYNLIAGTVTGTGVTVDAGSVSAAIQPIGNGWYRCILSFTWLNASITNTSVRVCLANSVTNTGAQPSFTGDGYSGIYIWGAQLETGAFPTSYIKTEVSQVTRAAESASMTGANFSSWYSQGEGALLAKYRVASIGVSPGMAIVSASNGAAHGVLLYKGLNSSMISAYKANAPVTIGAASSDEVSTSALSYNNLQLSGAHNSAAPLTTQAPSYPAPDRFQIGSNWNGLPFTGHIRRITYYPKRLSDAQLQALTA